MRRSSGRPALRSTMPFCTSISAAHGVDDAAELDERAVAGALDDAAVMHGDGRVDEVAAQRPKPRERALLVRAREPAVADHVGGEDGGELAGFGHSSGAPARRMPSTRRSR